MAKTSKDARRHIREWSNFFSDLKSATDEEIEKFLRSREKKNYLKQSLQRLEKRGFLLKKENKFFPTPKGLRFFSKLNLLDRNKQALKKWDGKWRLISFDVPVVDDKKRYLLRGLLHEFNFYKLQKSVWICPNQLAADFWNFLVDYELDKYCKVMVVEVIEGDDELKAYFGI
ncbi:MAG: repressor in the phenylacetic acid catabolism [Candidatus Jorgensenbacteria bacterium GW2011_GWB1_50_10]|uniref:Repressor in the phenylacetic acid catabolism n=1 Tax=Candidatus Jorgensenbacteria bacterium GW2011_GWB1_50_10 TaxID=1618665 RepID=A0A0G1YHI4_9BACT|nr:MAG: repressor in the phenylacetic acid catabolism [Candidatus Jorgensenbacteria bacterium GW2011_GWB1_50_10]